MFSTLPMAFFISVRRCLDGHLQHQFPTRKASANYRTVPLCEHFKFIEVDQAGLALQADGRPDEETQVHSRRIAPSHHGENVYDSVHNLQ